MIEITGSDATRESVVAVARGAKVKLSERARTKMLESRTFIENAVKNGEVIYGVNTGFGAFSSVRISDAQIEDLQRNLIRSHACGVGEAFTPEETRAIMYLRANALARGHSGIRPTVVEKIIEFLTNDVIPYIPAQGSVGASGDLAPLSHLALSLIGEGEVWSEDRTKPVDTASYLQKKNIKPLELKAKEGLSLINGCQVMTAVGMLAAERARVLSLTLDIAGSASLEALRGSRSAFDPLIPETRPHPGEKKTARNLLRLLTEGSEIAKSHENCDKVQDPYSLRCMPAVHGAVKDTLRRAIEVLEVEANSSTDNPLVFSENKKILSCGNFHGEPVAFQLDFLAIALSAAASISECRISKLINPNFSGLPAFLTPDGGLNSGMMIVQVAAASLVSENKIHSHPASVDSIPTSVDKEDHVSMGTIAARKFKKVVENAENVLAMELLCANQGLHLLKPLKASNPVEKVMETIRKKVAPFDKDRYFAKDIGAIANMIRSGELLQVGSAQVGELEW